MNTLISEKICSPQTIAGIDTLYYFYETNDKYDDLYLEILDQLDDAKARFEKRDLKYENKDIQVLINNQAFRFNGKVQGFYWFTHIDEYVKIGFKDYMTNRGINDIQTQLTAKGIYTLGLKSILKYVDGLLADYITEHKPLTRVDLNIFVQDDLTYINKDMFVTRKRRYVTLSKEIANKHRLETLYIGKKPFLLRVYDKQEEVHNSNKKEMMFEYFLMNGFKSLNNIWNIEFEMHRDYFKAFKIDTVDDLLERAELLFKDCLQAVRLVDLSSITDNTKDNKNKNRATTHLLWKHLAESYKLKDFLSIDTPLERVKRKSYSYTIEDAMKEQVALARKAYVHNIIVDEQFYTEVLQSFTKTKESVYADTSKSKKDVITVYENINESVNVKELNELELEKYINRLEADMTDPNKDVGLLIKKHIIALVEQKNRGIVNNQEFPF
ncbi:hypothetical protein [Sulfurimonas sp.]